MSPLLPERSGDGYLRSLEAASKWNVIVPLESGLDGWHQIALFLCKPASFYITSNKRDLYVTIVSNVTIISAFINISIVIVSVLFVILQKKSIL